MNIESSISSMVVKAISDLYGQEVSEKMVQLQKTRSEFEGNLTLVVFPFLKMSKKKPEDTAKEIGDYLIQEILSIRIRGKKITYLDFVHFYSAPGKVL